MEKNAYNKKTGYNDTVFQKLVITGRTAITWPGYNESIVMVPGDSL